MKMLGAGLPKIFLSALCSDVQCPDSFRGFSGSLFHLALNFFYTLASSFHVLCVSCLSSFSVSLSLNITAFQDSKVVSCFIVLIPSFSFPVCVPLWSPSASHFFVTICLVWVIIFITWITAEAWPPHIYADLIQSWLHSVARVISLIFDIESGHSLLENLQRVLWINIHNVVYRLHLF